MARIKTTKGILKYKPYPLYTGIAHINKEIETENLLIIKEVFDRNHIPFVFVAGTCLGAIRDHDFIDHDDDIDLALYKSDMPKVTDLLWVFLEAGFKVARYDRRCIISIIRKGQFVDFAFFEDYDEKCYSCDGWLMPKEFIDNTTVIDFLGRNYLVPKDYEGYLYYSYGANWRTPVQYFNYHRPKIQVLFIIIAEKIKAYLPGFIYFPLKKRAEKKVARSYMPKLERYYDYLEARKQ